MAQHHRCIGLLAPNTLVTCAGRHVSFHALDAARTTFLEVTEANVLETTAALVSSSGKYAGLLQRTTAASATPGCPDQVAIYSVKAGKLARAIAPPKPGALALDLAFSDGLCKNLAVVWGGPEPHVALYRWYAGKVLATLAVADVVRVAFDPSSAVRIAVATRHAALRLELDEAAGNLAKRSLYEQNKVCTYALESRSLACMRPCSPSAHTSHGSL